MLKFPSPCGVMVIGNTQYFEYQSSVRLAFPSPCGVMVIGNYAVKCEELWEQKGFRPLAG